MFVEIAISNLARKASKVLLHDTVLWQKLQWNEWCRANGHDRSLLLAGSNSVHHRATFNVKKSLEVH